MKQLEKSFTDTEECVYDEKVIEELNTKMAQIYTNMGWNKTDMENVLEEVKKMQANLEAVPSTTPTSTSSTSSTSSATETP